MPDALAWAGGLGVLGAILGSFIAALATRWPDGRSVVHGRSACDGCGTTLQASDLVPLLSFIWLRGRCRHCRAAIAPLHWRVELAGAVVGVAAGAVAGGPEAVAGAAFGWLLLTLATLDLVAWWLPDRLVVPLAAFGLVLGQGVLIDRAIGGVVGFGALWLVAFGYRRWRGREGMGGGDPKLFGAIGCWLGWAMLPAVLMVASLVGLGAVAGWRLAGRSVAADTAVPFGALLAVAAYLGWLVMVAMAP